ncbi:Valyl-tRNA synthetase [Rubellimicrobium mesophilum DSM 19309]|uniref:Valine--tRNA ligase n=1 Tax=Rubellimicrobium mesophilum DSM 19309 TaxID=442562 RepID=A0A017HQT3_9RHOB|nr:valine--tRNA ligase [Rubellimicrobium mesophilum]EYD76513.1 Valyl-tRNA synthetase [Rubellimicrobium mesophilum DSM 19309]
MDKTFQPAEAEARIARLWEEAGAFRAGANARPGAQPFSIVIPPPNVTGSLHMGHAFNNTLQDVLARWHRMRGDDVLWQPGQDHAGIATQMVVERELARQGNEGRRELGRARFLQKVWEWKEKSGGTIIEQLKRLGASCDWSRNAFTMDPHFQRAVLEVFVRFYEEGLIYRGKRLVNWDPHFETAISDLEVENREVHGHMWHFKYPLAGGETYTYTERDADGNVTFEEVRDYISIATTRPETMLGDGAVAVHPSDARYAPIVGQLCEIPVGPKAHRRLIPIITDEYPDPNFGSGAVKITGAHDFNDYAVAQRNGIPLYTLMDTKARMRSDGLSYEQSARIASGLARLRVVPKDEELFQINLVPDDMRGLDRLEARRLVVSQIESEGLAVMAPSADGPVPFVESKTIMQPFGDRSNVVIEPMLTDQWFVDTAKIVGPAIEAVRTGATQILPERDAKTYFHWLENIEPWCISRQLWWGHQIPVWYGFDLHRGAFRDETGDDALNEIELGDLLLQDDFVGAEPRRECAVDFAAVSTRFADSLAELPHPLDHARVVEVTDARAAEEAFAQGLADYNLTQDPTKLVYPVWRDPDVLDTWFSSGLWPLGTLGWPNETEEFRKYYPTSVLVTGFDIIFFWVARMMMMDLALVGEVPFRTVYVHALVRDEKGKKMSKSLGNVLDPLDLIDEFGADAVRFTLAAMAAMGRDLRLSTQRIAGYRNFGTKLWNAHRFAEMNGVFQAPRAPGVPQATAPVNRWIIGETARVREEVDAALDSYRFDGAANALHAFVWGVVCDWYVEFSKPLLQGEDAALKAETQAVMAWVLDQCLILMHPFMPFITEDLWQSTAQRPTLLAHADWPLYRAQDLVDPGAESEMRWAISLIEGVRSARAQLNVPAGLTVPMVMTEADPAARQALARNAALIQRLARIEAPTEGAAPRGSLTVATPGATFALPLEGLIDIRAEIARMTKGADKAAKEAAALRGRLANPRFVESAAEEVVEEARENLALREAEEAQLRAALARLSELV